MTIIARFEGSRQSVVSDQHPKLRYSVTMMSSAPERKIYIFNEQKTKTQSGENYGSKSYFYGLPMKKIDEC